MPSLEVTDLGASDAKDYAQDFSAAGSLREAGVETASTLLDEGKVKSRCVSNCLNEVGIVRIGVSSGNRRMLPDRQRGNGLSRGIAEVGGLGAAAVASPPGGIDGELHQIGEAAELVGACGFAAGQGAEAIEVDSVRAFRSQICVD